MSNGPSNIRINPFVGSGGATTYVNLTETHIIPSVSPFVIRLNEVPEKRDPSNMRCVYVDDTTGAVTSSALTEVAATPAAGQFRPDYSTKADKDDSWNTGLIEFNSADAGKIVQISYTGMGTLAAVQSNKYPSWYTDRGDGSDGDFIPSENTTIDGIKNYKRVFIKAGVTVKSTEGVIIKVTDNVIIHGTLDANGTAGADSGSYGTDKGGAGGYFGGGGGGTGISSSVHHDGYNGLDGTGGGAGGRGSDKQYGEGNGGAPGIGGKSLSVINSSFNGYGNGAGGGGGGGADKHYDKGGAGGGGGGKFIAIIAGEINISSEGKVMANGGKGGDSVVGRRCGAGGGGGGGDICLIANTIINNGSVTNEGGERGNISTATAGQAGRILIKQLGVL